MCLTIADHNTDQFHAVTSGRCFFQEANKHASSRVAIIVNEQHTKTLKHFKDIFPLLLNPA